MAGGLPISEAGVVRKGVAIGQLARRTLGDLRFLVTTFLVALPAFVLCTVLFAAGAATTPIIAGLFLLTICLQSAGSFSRVHRTLLAGRGIEIAQTVYPAPTNRLRSRFRRLTHPQSWRELLHVLLVFIISTATFPIAIAWCAAGPAGILYAIFGVWMHTVDDSLSWLLGLPGRAAQMVVYLLLSVIVMAAAPYVLRGLVLAHAGIARALLDDEASQLREQVSQLATSRAAAGEAEAYTLRRLERDLHDGPQQRLVRLGMDLSAAERRMGTDPDQARAMLRSALVQSQEALAEIRTLSRGIAPPILSEQGLRAAITALAARSIVPTTVDVDDVPLSDAAQNAAYFVTAEALANMAKHSGASSCLIELRRAGAVAVVTVTDDGVGGASAAKGHGLAGLSERLRGVDGTLAVHSPAGGPTHLTATIPLASP